MSIRVTYEKAHCSQLEQIYVLHKNKLLHVSKVTCKRKKNSCNLPPLSGVLIKGTPCIVGQKKKGHSLLTLIKMKLLPTNMDNWKDM